MDAVEVGTWAIEDAEAHRVRRAKARDGSVWAHWYDNYHGLVYRYAYSRLNSPDEAADVAAQVFVVALRSIDRYQYRGRPVLAWFYGIARNLVSEHLKRAKRQQLTLLLAEEADDTASISVNKLALREAVAKLTPDQREVVTLTFLLNLSVREAARALRKKEATIYSLQARAVANLRRLIAA
jgi:RNA polymerase sigma-70 factor (ECF subfamily)